MRNWIPLLILAMAAPAASLEVTVNAASAEETALIMEACGEHDRAARIDGTATIEECVVELVNVSAQKLLRVRVERLRRTSLREEQNAKLTDWRATFERQADLRICGDAELDDGEECDPGSGNFDDSTPDTGCRPGCRDPYCGDGVKDSGESCDPGANARCKADCSGVEEITP